MTVGKFIGCVLMVVGSAIGAGILGLPMASAPAGFTTSLITMLGLWILLTISGLMVSEAAMRLPDNACSFNSMAAQALGPIGKAIVWISYLLLLYTTLVAYVSGGPDLVFKALHAFGISHIPRSVIALLFTLVMGLPVFWSTKATDHCNRVLIFFKGFLLLFTLVLIAAYIDVDRLFTVLTKEHVDQALVASPIMLCLFNYHFVIPSIRMYIGRRPQAMRWIIILGTTISLIIYIFWLAPVLSIIPLQGENSFSVIGGSPGELTRILTTIINNKWLQISIHGFANISITTAFLGVSLGLFDFLADGLKIKNDRLGRFKTALLTFLPPLGINLFYPDSFLKSFSYSGIFVAILFLILPPIIIYKLNGQQNLAMKTKNGGIQSGLKKFGLLLISISGVVFTLFPLLVKL